MEYHGFKLFETQTDHVLAPQRIAKEYIAYVVDTETMLTVYSRRAAEQGTAHGIDDDRPDTERHQSALDG